MLDTTSERLESYQGFNPPNLYKIEKEGHRIINEFLDVGAARRREIELGKKGG